MYTRSIDARQTLRAYRCFLGVKFLYSVCLGDFWSSAERRGLFAFSVCCTLALFTSRFAWWGAAGWLLLKTGQVLLSWPYTLNHFVLETLLVFLLVLYPAACRDQQSSGVRKILWVAWGSILSVWFFSAIQKLGHGAFVRGEVFAIELTAGQRQLGSALRHGLRAIDWLSGSSAGLRFPTADGIPSALTTTERAYCLILSWSVVASEFALPLLALWRRTRGWALSLLLCGQLVIACVSGEFDFAWTALATLALGDHRWPHARYLALAAVSAPATWWMLTQ